MNGNRNGNSSHMLQFLPAASVGQNRLSNVKNPILDYLIPHGSGRLEEGREGKKRFAFFAFHQGSCFFIFLFMLIVNLFKIRLGKTKYEWIKLKSIFVLITAF